MYQHDISPAHTAALLSFFKGPSIKKLLLTCIEKLPVNINGIFLKENDTSGYIVLLHGQFIHHTEISLYPNTQFLVLSSRLISQI